MILYLVRHAKSSWNQRNRGDRERPLSKRGRTDAPRMFGRLREHAPVPKVIVSSDAVRAAETARALAKALDYEPDRLRFERQLYHADVERIIEAARHLPDTATAAALVGHNPGMTWAANTLARNLELDNLPTCGIVGIEFDIRSWQELESGLLCYFDYPKNPDAPMLRSPASL